MLLDADVLIDLLRGREKARAWLSVIEELPAISGMALLEALYGARDTLEQRKVEDYVKPFSIFWPNEADAQVARKFARYRLSDGIELNDSITAAIAIRHSLTLVTFNVKHFRSIPGLATMQPYPRV